MTLSISHIGICVSDLERSVRFYCEGLGLVLRHRQLQHNAYTGSLVGYPDAALEIAQLRLSDVEPPPSGHVLELICYERPASGLVDLERSTIGAGHLAFVVAYLSIQSEWMHVRAVASEGPIVVLVTLYLWIRACDLIFDSPPDARPHPSPKPSQRSAVRADSRALDVAAIAD